MSSCLRLSTGQHGLPGGAARLLPSKSAAPWVTALFSQTPVLTRREQARPVTSRVGGRGAGGRARFESQNTRICAVSSTAI